MFLISMALWLFVGVFYLSDGILGPSLGYIVGFFLFVAIKLDVVWLFFSVFEVDLWDILAKT